MSDNNIKTVVLSGSEICVDIPRRNCNIRNMGGDMIYK